MLVLEERPDRVRAQDRAAHVSTPCACLDGDGEADRRAAALLRHDLCNPLNAILGFSDLLAASEQLSAQHRRYAANIQAAGTVLLRRIDALLERARAGSTGQT
jgi:signal transduction histidine kinase